MSKRVLNVGGDSKATPLPPHFAGWQHDLLDIRPGPDVDLVMDARELGQHTPGVYDAVFCSHNLEHYYRHDVYKVLAGFQHVLKPDGFVHIIVPDLHYVLERMIKLGLDLDDTCYQAQVGPIKFRDIVYGYGPEIESTGEPHYAHKTGFSPKIMEKVLLQAGFEWMAVGDIPQRYEVLAYASVKEPSEATLQMLGLA